MRKIFLNFLKFALTFGILYYLYSKGMLDFSRVQSVFKNIPVMLTVLALLVLCQLAGVVRWQLLLKGQSIVLDFKETLYLTMIGVFFNTALPGAVSGDVVKGYYVIQKSPDKRGRVRAFTTLLLDRLLGLSALIFVSFMAMFLNVDEMSQNPSLKSLSVLVSALWVGVLVFFALMLLDTPITRKIQKLLPKLPMSEIFIKFFDAFKAYESCRHYMIKGFLISVGIHLSIVTSIIIISHALGGFEYIPLHQFFFLVPFGLLVTAIPVAPAGLGTGHAAFFGLFQLAGSKAGADLFTAYVSFQIFISLVGGLFYLKYKGSHPLIQEEMQEKSQA